MRGLVVIVAVLAVAGCGSGPSGGGAAPTPSAAGRITAPPAGSVPPDEPGGPSPRPSTRACAAAELAGTASLALRNGAAGTLINTLALRRAGGSRCTLGGHPALLATAGGGPSPVPARRGSPFERNPYAERPAVLDPADSARVNVYTSMSCRGGIDPVTYTGVRLVVAGRRIPVPGLTLRATCPIQVGGWYRQMPSG